ncbi:unnamed protein product, partial [Ectocarpus fasciculatus]
CTASIKPEREKSCTADDMVEFNLGHGGEQGGDSSSHGESSSLSGRLGGKDGELNKEILEKIFAEDDPHRQFELFAKRIWMPDSASMSTQDRLIAEYDYLNVMFCREQNFSMEQTIAFRGITLGVFEATIVRGEMDLEGAFEAFTERVLSLAEVPETPTSTAGGDSGGSNIHSNGVNNRSRTGGLAVDSKAQGTEHNEAANTTASSLPPNRHGVGDDGGEGGAVFSVGDIGA